MSIVPKGMYLGHSCKYILPSEDISMKCLLGFMNSKLANFFFRCFSTNSNVNGYEIDNLPIPNISKDNQIKLRDLVKSIMEKKNSDNYADTQNEESKIDDIVYQLYNLTIEERLVIEK